MEKIIQYYTNLEDQYGLWVDIVFGAVIVLLALLLFAFIYKNLKLYLSRQDQHLVPIFKDHVYKPGIYVFISIGLVVGNELLSFDNSISQGLGQFFSILLIIASAHLLINIIIGTKEFMLGRYDMGAADNLKARKIYTQYRIIERVLKFMIIVFTIGFVLMTFENIRKIGVSLLASAGVAGIIIGFAAQRSISTIIAGIQIAFTQPIRLEDVVIVEGEWGRIEEIGLTYVVVRIWDQRRLVVPINYFIEQPFQNWTRTSSELLGTVFLYVDYAVNLEEMRRFLQDTVKNNPLWDGRVSIVQVTDSKERTMELRALVSSEDSPSLWDLRCEVREALLKWVQKHYPESLPVTRVSLEPDKTAQLRGDRNKIDPSEYTQPGAAS